MTPDAASPDDEPLPVEFAQALAPPESPGELARLGNYRITKALGSGAMAVVFQAEDLRLGRVVALKVLKPAMAENVAARKRFLREARATAALDHENIIAVFQADEDRGLPFLAMPLLKGETLHALLRRQKQATPSWLPTADVLRIGREIAEGLAAAHERGLIHRDIKPANIWLEKRNDDHRPEAIGTLRVKLLDFGIVRVADEDQRLTASGALIGTLAFMSPEQAVGGKIDNRCDLFSLGCVLYRMATGQLAFNGPNAPAIVNALKQTEPPPPQDINPTLPPALAALIRQLLAKDREKRPRSARDVVAALRAIEEPAKGEPATVEIAPSTRSADKATIPSTAIGRWKLVLFLLIVILMSVLGVAWRFSR